MRLILVSVGRSEEIGSANTRETTMEEAAFIFTWITCGIRLKPFTRLSDSHCIMASAAASTVVLVMTALSQFEVYSVLHGCHTTRPSMYFLSSFRHSS